VISFVTPHERSVDAWRKGLNSHLPSSVRVHWVRRVLEDFHARFSATGRRYLYVFQEGEADPLAWNRVTPAGVLDDAAMHAAAQCLVGEHDFTALRAAACQSPTPFRRVDHVMVRRYGPYIVIDVAANAFLLRMMRNIAGVLSRVGRGEWRAFDVQSALQGRDRNVLGRTAPPGGLYLVDVHYPDLFLLDRSDQASGWPPGRLPPILQHRYSLDRL
jgi:tRNA pseudouridine38-40 synthase